MNKNEIDKLLLKLDSIERNVDRFLKEKKIKKQEPIIKRQQEHKETETEAETETEVEECDALFIQEEEERRRYFEKW